MSEETPVYVISIAAQLSGLHPQTLRQYDRLGLVSPGRSSGRGRRYSARDIARLRAVQQLTAEGVNLAGVQRILALENVVHELQRRIAELEAGLPPAGNPAAPPPGSTPGPAPAPRAPTRNLPVPLPAHAGGAVVRWRSTRQY